MLYNKMKFDIIKYTWQAGKDLKVADTSFTDALTIWGGHRGYMISICGRVNTAFAGITGPVWMEIGNSTTSDLIMVKRNLANAGDLIIKAAPFEFNLHSGACNMPLRPMYNLTAPVVKFSSDSGNLADLTAGEVEIVMINLIQE